MPTAATVAAAANVATAEDEEKPNEQKREVASATDRATATAQVMLVLELHFLVFFEVFGAKIFFACGALNGLRVGLTPQPPPDPDPILVAHPRRVLGGVPTQGPL